MKEYMSTYELMEEFGISKSTIQRTRDRMRKQIGKKDGFSPYCIRGKGKALRMRREDFIRAWEDR